MKIYIAVPSANGDGAYLVLVDDDGQWHLRFQPADPAEDVSEFGPIDVDDLTKIAEAWIDQVKAGKQ